MVPIHEQKKCSRVATEYSKGYKKMHFQAKKSHPALPRFRSSIRVGGDVNERKVLRTELGTLGHTLYHWYMQRNVKTPSKGRSVEEYRVRRP